MLIQRRKAILSGVIAIAGVISIQAFNSFACYGHDLWSFLGALGIFLSLPLLPAILSLVTANPLRAVGACLLFAPWLFFAYYTDCVRPYTGGGASMIYIAVILWGTPSSIIGALVTGTILRAVGIRVEERKQHTQPARSSA
ncbi:Na+:solute symporter [Luteimonas panaciterrae]|uniref:Na+:solute symporter n=1 Tax=Luteimonas panaciterrae TaxID=363885 RepID=UPI001CFBE6EF|nr:Na+:solute symporter [Luteimonas panaciterrae]